MVNPKYNFSAVFLTKDYYPMLDGCIYKHSKSDFNNINVINVDMGSLDENLNEGKHICDKLNIKMVNETAISSQEGIKKADDYLTKNKIDTDWMICFQHDVFPLTETFWDDLQEILDLIDIEKVGMIGGTSFSTHENGIKATKNINISSACYGKTKSGRGMLCKDVLKSPYHGWYMNLPPEYYKSKYFAVESPYWCCFIINRKLFQKHILIDPEFVFELWPDDLAYQFLAQGKTNITIPKLFVCHDHALKQGIKINSGKLIEPRHDFNGSHMRFWKKWGFRWGVRNPDVRTQFYNKNSKIYNKSALQHKFFTLNISDGPLDIDLKTTAPQ